MDDIDRYWKLEYRDAEYRQYQAKEERSKTPRWGARLVRWWRTLRPVQAALPLPSGESALHQAVVVWSVGPEEPNVYCLEGVLWMTRTVDNRDYLLSAGQGRRLEAGEWVAQALAPARYRVYRGASEEVYCGKADLLPAL